MNVFQFYIRKLLDSFDVFFLFYNTLLTWHWLLICSYVFQFYFPKIYYSFYVFFLFYNTFLTWHWLLKYMLCLSIHLFSYIGFVLCFFFLIYNTLLTWHWLLICYDIRYCMWSFFSWYICWQENQSKFCWRITNVLKIKLCHYYFFLNQWTTHFILVIPW